MDRNNSKCFVLIRIPKCGSSSLQHVVASAYPQARVFNMIGNEFGVRPSNNLERLRTWRKKHKRIWRDYRCFSIEKAWQKIDRKVGGQDIVAGHFSYDEVELPNHDKQFVVLFRNPVDRLLSDYNYSRNGYNKRSALRKLYNRGRLHAAANYSFEGYLEYLSEREDYYGNILRYYAGCDDTTDDPVCHLEQNFFAFGLIEQFERFCQEFSSKTGCDLATKAVNVTPNKKILQLSRREKSLAEKICARDLEFYERVQKRAA